MSKYSVLDLWNQHFGKQNEVFDYAGRRMLKSACGNQNSSYEPTIEHVRPLSQGGKDVIENIVICNWKTNEEKADRFPHWNVNGMRFHARKKKYISNGYDVIKER